MRTALVNASSVVQEIIMAGPNYTPPGGFTAIASETANIGDFWNQSTHSFQIPVKTATQAELIQYAQTLARSQGLAGTSVNVNPAGVGALVIDVGTTIIDRTDLQGAVLQAQQSAGFTTVWLTTGGAAFTLNADQIIALGLGVSAYINSLYSIANLITKEILAGTITTLDQVTKPPSPIPAWPHIKV